MSSSVLYYALGLKNILYQSNRYYGKVAMHGESVVAKSPKKSSPHGSAAFHGGVLRIAQKGLYVRTAIAMVPFHLLPIDALTNRIQP
jgi:hypothetical protein